MTSARKFAADGPVGRLTGVRLDPSGEPVGAPVLLVHGINMTRDAWTDVARLLAPTRVVVSFDLRGHGTSAHRGPYTAAGYAADAAAVLDNLDIPVAHVVGTSFGGSTSCAFASTWPDRTASVACFGSALTVEGIDVDAAIALLRSVGARAFFGQLLPQATFAPGVDPILIERALDAACTGRDIETIAEVATTALTADSTVLAQGVSAPALVVTGELDRTCPVPLGRSLADALHTELTVLPTRGHLLSMEDPATVANLIERHVASTDQS